MTERRVGNAAAPTGLRAQQALLSQRDRVKQLPADAAVAGQQPQVPHLVAAALSRVSPTQGLHRPEERRKAEAPPSVRAVGMRTRFIVLGTVAGMPTLEILR